LRRDPPGRERRELIANVAACVDSLERLFNAILGVARAADSDRRKDVVAMELQDLIDRVVLQLKPEAEARGLRLRVRRTSARVEADPGDLERILTNLVANGIRYAEHGGVLVGARRRARGVDLIVVDTGVGLREEDQQRIFEPFYQVGVPQRDRDQGFGLGLATVRQLCLRHGYEIDVRSKFGRGARFRISLPPARQETRPAPVAAAAPDLVAEKLNVLLVEDDPLVADAVRRILEAWDVTVHVSATAEGGLALLRRAGSRRWHALLDYRLPGGLTGLELAEEIRTQHGAAVRITLITGEADPAIFEAAKRSGFLVLQKPLRPIRLRALLGSEGALTATAS
jgi:CheY-like chemotaxis protein